MGQSRPLFVYFLPFHITNQLQIDKSIDGVLGIQTRGRRMEGADETTELWRPPLFYLFGLSCFAYGKLETYLPYWGQILTIQKGGQPYKISEYWAVVAAQLAE